MGLFDFMAMNGTYETRKVARTEGEGFTVSTASVTDSTKPYETAVMDERYHNGFVVVEQYTGREEAREGHERWVEMMTNNPPNELVECGTSDVTALVRAMDPDSVRYKRRA